MTLLRLPSETLEQIFDYVGSSYFHEDIRRLMVSKHWFEFARPVCIKHVRLSQEALRLLMSPLETNKLSPIRVSLESLEIELNGHQPRSETICAREDTHGSITLEPTFTNDVLRDDTLPKWIEALDDDLQQLANLARESRKLRSLRIACHGAPPAGPLDIPADYISLPRIHSLLSVENLSVLMLDLTTNFLNTPDGRGSCDHICAIVGGHLQRLQVAHLRMPRICPDILKPRASNTSLKLKVLVINLSLKTKLPGITSASHAKRCGSSDGGFLELKSDIHQQAEVLVTQMQSPKTLRILTHSLPNLDTQSIDVLSGDTMILENDMAWDGDGKVVVEDSQPESDLSDDEFQNYLDN